MDETVLTPEELSKALWIVKNDLETWKGRVRAMEHRLSFVKPICTWPEEDYQLHLTHPQLWKTPEQAPTSPLPRRTRPT